MSALVLGRWDADDLHTMFARAGVLAALQERGFADLRVHLDGATGALVHVRLSGAAGGCRHDLLDCCLTRSEFTPAWFAALGFVTDRPIGATVVYWLREQDPTRPFDASRPRLPGQKHPGLGVLRRAYRIVHSMAVELGDEGVVCFPKFYHDAVIFYLSRRFLFLDGVWQGRFQAMMRDLGDCSLADASLAMAAGAVRDATGAVVHWQPGPQVVAVGPRLLQWFQSEAYLAAVARAADAWAYRVDADRLVEARAVFASESLRVQDGRSSADGDLVHV